MKPTLIFISHSGLQHIQKQKNSKRVGYIDCLYYNRMTHYVYDIGKNYLALIQQIDDLLTKIGSMETLL